MSRPRLGYRNTTGARLGEAEGRVTRGGRLWRWLRALTRTRRVQTIDGVRYEELDAIPLRRALARGVPKRYRVRFPGGARMVVAASGTHPIADLQGPGDLGEFTLIDPSVRPGDRVLLLHAGAGHGPQWLAERLGPTGAMVALEADAPSVRYAKRRYHTANTALEWCDLSGPKSLAGPLAGELDGAFDAIVHRRLPADPLARAAHLAECWRLLAPGRTMALLLASPSGHHDPREDPRLAALEAELWALADESPPGLEHLQRVRVRARCGLLVRKAEPPDDTPLPGEDDQSDGGSGGSGGGGGGGRPGDEDGGIGARR
ncbi:MAG: class I SAM-dependent methyltransferase [Phycisphaeraceae bacterium]|nr:class I SAM-dependent methyltransferase [Phycisphaeraceae bacterium]